MCNSDLIIEKINNLSAKIDENSSQSQREMDLMNAHLGTINNSITSLSGKVATQNGRISKVEAWQSHCPGNAMKETFRKYQADLKPVYVLATNMRMIAFMVIAAAIVFNLINVGLEWLINMIKL